MVYILGIHMGHDATAALIDESGKVLAAVAEERLTRVKYHTGFPYYAIEFVLKKAGIQKIDVSAVVLATERLLEYGNEELNRYYFLKDDPLTKELDLFNPQIRKDQWKKISGLLWKNLSQSQTEQKDFVAKSIQLTHDRVKEKICEIGFEHADFKVIEHHHTHATSAFFTSGHEDALVITIDGAGDGLCATASVGVKGRVKRLSSASAACSPGAFYAEITRFLGYRRNRHEGKITGLAAYGNPEKYYKQLSAFLKFNPDTEQFVFDEVKDPALIRKFKTFRRLLTNVNFGRVYMNQFNDFLKKQFNPETDGKDLSAAAQAVLEDVVVQYAQHFINKSAKQRIVLAGGIFANVKVNQRIAEIPETESVFVHQNMGDGGCALGAAFSYLYEHKNTPYKAFRTSNVYYGNSYTNDEIEEALKEKQVKYERHDNIEEKIGALIHGGHVIGRFNGGMEYGPRALGNRSVLARPTEAAINDWLNKRMHRTEFMPFAPSVLYEYADELFENFQELNAAYTACFMTITFDVKKEWQEKTQATTHIDGTARPQLVTQEANPSYYKIIDAYRKLSGIPAIINTSFNMHEEPIVATPYDAIKAFERGMVDYLAIGDFLVSGQ